MRVVNSSRVAVVVVVVVVVVVNSCCYLLCQVALKYMDKKSVCGVSLAREIDLLLRLSHPYIVEVFRVVESTAWCAVEMELAANGDLVDYIHGRGGGLPEAEARFLYRQLCQAVSYCHSVGVVHRDIKCDNVLLTENMDVKLGGKSVSLYVYVVHITSFLWLLVVDNIIFYLYINC